MAGGEPVDHRVCSSTAAMRRPRVLGRLRLSVALLLTYLTYATTHTEKHLVCRKPDSKICLVWTTAEHNTNQQNSMPLTIVSVYCGFINILPEHSQSKYIQLNKSGKISSKRLFCEQLINEGQFINWTKVAEELEKLFRVRRQSFIPRGRYRGQTQSQYLAIDRGNGKDEGKAEAHSAADSSRASVSGNSGMGQAQSQSIYDPSCDDCNGKTNQEIENLKRPSGLKPENQYDPSVGSTWPGHVGPNQLPDKSYTQTSPDHYGSSYRPTAGQLPPGSKGNGNEIYGPQVTGANRPGVGHGTAGPGPVGPGTIGDSNYRPSTTNGGYGSINYPGGTSYQPVGGQGGNGFTPISGKYDPVDTTSNKDLVHNGLPVGLEPGSNGLRPGYTTSNINMENFKPGANSGPGSYGNQNTGVGNTNNRDPNSIAGIPFNNYRPQESGNNNYIPGYNVNKYGDHPGNIIPGYGNNFIPQNGVANFGNGEPNSNINRDSIGGISNPSTSQSNSGYLPGSHIPEDSSRPYGPQNALNQKETGLPHWPLANGPYPGPAGTNVYCCIVPNNVQNGNLYPNNIYSSDKIPPTSGKSTNVPYVPSGGANNLMAPSGQYGPNGYGTGNSAASYRPIGQYGSDSTGAQYGPGNIGTQVSPNGNVATNVPQGPSGTGSFPITGGYYGGGVRPYGTSSVGGGYVPGGRFQSPDVQYRPSNTGESLTPSGKYVPTVYSPGSSSGPGGQYGQVAIGSPTETGLQYGPGGPGTSVVPGGQYMPGNIAGPAGTGLQYGPGSLGNSVTPGLHYGSGGNREPGSGTAHQYGPGSTTVPGGQYETGSSRGPTGVGSQYGPGSTAPGGQYGSSSGTPGTGIQNIPGSSGGPVGPGRQYESTSSGGSPGTGIQYGSGIGSPSVSVDQYRPGSAERPISNAGQYGLVNSGGPAGPNGQYGQGGPGSSVGPGEHYPGGAGTQYIPGSTGTQYMPGGPGGLYTPSAPERQYPSTVSQGPIDSAGLYGPGNFNGNGQYGPGSTVGPGRQYGPGASVGQYLPGNTGGQYSPGGVGGQYSPGSGSYAPGVAGNTGQYIPGSSGVSVAPSGHYGTGSGIENGGQYGSGPGNQYAPGSPGVSGSSYGPGNVGGHTGNSGQFGPEKYGISSGPNNKYNNVPENVVDPNSVTADGDDSEAEASIAQNINGTTASASSKGGNDKGRAQTNVQGTYTGSGSFQAQAQIIGENKEAQSEVNGGKKGASSSATGSGRNNKSQANVQLGSETGSIQTQSQSNGVMHSSNSQVQGSVKGGTADAQARGPGSTSSQAQIGFTPYKDEEKNTHDRQKLPFIGGGMASAQSSGRTGQSQSQLHGTFKYGISYNGAAQSGASLDKDAIFPNRLSFEKIDVFDEKNKNIDVDKISIDNATEFSQPFITEPPPSITSTSIFPSINDTDNAQTPTTEYSVDESMTNSESRNSGHSHLDHHVSEGSNKTDFNESPLLGNRRSFQTNYPSIPDYEFTTDKDDTQPEYDTDVGFDGDANEASDVEQAEYTNYDEYTRDSSPQQYLQSPSRKGIDVQQTTGGNTQHIVLGSLKNHNAEIIQRDTERPDESKVYQPGERVPGTGGYTIPVGFTGSVKSVASKDKTYVVGSKDSPSQAQTVTLTPGTGKVKYTHPSSYGKYVKPKNLRSLQSPKENENKYVSVSKSVTRDLDSDNNIRKQYSHTYYTKSSSCGYFTFTCTMVSSAEGRKKVCKPKMPTNPDGTPIRC